MVEQIDITAADGHHGRFCNAFGPMPMSCSCGVTEAFAAHRIAAVEAELAKVVAWLRARLKDYLDESPDKWPVIDDIGDLLNVIERNEHRSQDNAG